MRSQRTQVREVVVVVGLPDDKWGEAVAAFVAR
jgi:acyl-CoA synthetase (AMP-forming)/AMP-acid ligase II